MGFWNTVEASMSNGSLQSRVNWIGLNTAFGFGVTWLSNRTSITGGINGVGVMVAVSVTEGVFVRLGMGEIVGERVIVGLRVIEGVTVIVGDGGKYRYATGSP